MRLDIYEEEFEEPTPRARVPERKHNFVNERQEWIQLTADMLKVPFKSVLFKTINWKMEWIRDHYLQSTKPEVKNPAKMWWGLIKWQKAKDKSI